MGRPRLRQKPTSITLGIEEKSKRRLRRIAKQCGVSASTMFETMLWLYREPGKNAPQQ